MPTACRRSQSVFNQPTFNGTRSRLIALMRSLAMLDAERTEKSFWCKPSSGPSRPLASECVFVLVVLCSCIAETLTDIVQRLLSLLGNAPPTLVGVLER